MVAKAAQSNGTGAGAAIAKFSRAASFPRRAGTLLAVFHRAALWFDLVQAGDLHRREDGLHDHPRPDAGEVVQDTFAIAK